MTKFTLLLFLFLFSVGLRAGNYSNDDISKYYENKPVYNNTPYGVTGLEGETELGGIERQLPIGEGLFILLFYGISYAAYNIKKRNRH